MFRTFGFLAVALATLWSPPSHALVRGKPVHALALYGEPKYGPDFKHFDYANADAPKGGEFVKSNEAALTFDTFNPYTIKGAPVQGLELLLYDTLMTLGQDEPATVYGLVAETIEIAPDNSWVQFVVRPEGHFSDGSKITAEDVVFSYDVMVSKAAPRYRAMYADVTKAEAISPNTVRFSIGNKDNRKLPFLLAEYLPVLSKAFWKDRDFTATILDIPVTNGPYVIDSFEVGKNIIYRRDPNYWGKDLAVNRGQFNFDRVRFEYFRDDTAQFEGFKSDIYDFKREVRARRWATEYNFPAMQDGRVKIMEVRSIQPMNNQPIFLNVRRPLFQDRRVREALSLAFDFETMNANLFYGQYVRNRSYWQGSPMEATGLPSVAELALLEPFRGKVPDELFTTEFNHPKTAGTGDARENLLRARELLTAAGWVLKDGKLVNGKTNQSFTFEVLNDQEGMERVFVPWIQNLERLGISANIRKVDTSQYINRVTEFDFDATTVVSPRNDLTPGPEQYEYWGSKSADAPGSANYGGVKDPVLDALIERLVAAETYDDVTTVAKAIDRVLTWNYYEVMSYTAPVERYAYWSEKLEKSAVTPALGWGAMGEFSDGMGESVIALWWAKPAGAAQAPTTPQTGSDAPSSNNTWVLALVVAGVLIVLFLVVRRRRAQ